LAAELTLRILASLAFLFLAAFTPVAANELSCRGRNLVEAMKTENPEQYRTLQALAASYPHGEGLFFRLEKEGAAPIHLFGTIHVEDARFKDFPDEVRAALDDADIIATELLESELNNPLTMLKIAALGANPKADTLVGYDADQRKMIETALQTRGILPSAAERMDASFLLLSLAYPVCAMETDPEKILTREVVDQAIARLGVSLGATNIGLETASQQIGAVTAMSPKSKKVLLVATAEADAMSTDVFITMKALYAERRIGVLKAMSRLMLPPGGEVEAAFNEFMNRLLDKRNETMVTGILEKAKTARVVVAVGALHLPGEMGIVALLEKQGYTATKIW
jgi:uncharacterized protein